MSVNNSQQISDIKLMLVKGNEGEGITSIEKTGTSGLVDTYTITFTDGKKTTFTVTNGKGITSIAKTGTSGNVDTYTITYNDGSTSTFTVTNGTDASVIGYDNTTSGLTANDVQEAIDEVVDVLSDKIDTDSGTFTDASSNTYTGQTVDMISYDNTNKQLLMKVNGADTVIPFSGGLKNICIVSSGYAGAAMACTIIDSNGNTNLTADTSVSSDDTFNVVWENPTGTYRYRVYAKKAGKYRVINNITTGRTDNIVNASVGQLLATVNGAASSTYNPIWGIATIQYL